MKGLLLAVAFIASSAFTVTGRVPSYGVREVDVPVGSNVTITKGESKLDYVWIDEDTILVRSYCKCPVNFALEVE